MIDTRQRRQASEAQVDRDARRLAAFEALVLSQVPAAAPWQPVTDYSFEARKAIEGIHPQLIQEVFQPQYVIDVGCGPGHLVTLLRQRGIDTWGVDLDQFDISMDCSITAVQGEWIRLWLRCSRDLVICREVLEHLTIRQIRRAVTNLCALSSRYVYVTTRFAADPAHLLDVDTSDALDPTHITMLHQTLLRVLFVLEGFTRRAELETRMDWQQKGRVLVYERT